MALGMRNCRSHKPSCIQNGPRPSPEKSRAGQKDEVAWQKGCQLEAKMLQEESRSGFRELLESIPRDLQSLLSPLRRSWQADDALSLRFPMFLGPMSI